MKTIGLIGGMTPESTILYYRFLNEMAADSYGKKHSCKILINSVDFGEVSKLQTEGRWDILNDLMAKAASNLEKAGANCILICANTMHLTVDAIKAVVKIPVIHIAEATGEVINASQLSKVALLGTKYTMEKTFYTDVLTSKGIQTLIPASDDRQIIHDIIYDELAFGVISKESKVKYLKIIEQLIEDGAEGIILGCTEIPMLIEQKDVSVPVFDTTKIHATHAFNLMNTEDEIG
jgi:aspartate racemase